MRRYPVDIRGNVTFGRLMQGLATVGLTVRLDARKLGWIGAPVKGSPGCNIMGHTGLTSMDEILKSGKALKMGATRSGWPSATRGRSIRWSPTW